MSSSVALEGTL